MPKRSSPISCRSSTCKCRSRLPNGRAGACSLAAHGAIESRLGKRGSLARLCLPSVASRCGMTCPVVQLEQKGNHVKAFSYLAAMSALLVALPVRAEHIPDPPPVSWVGMTTATAPATYVAPNPPGQEATQFQEVTRVSYRAPVGHTHTCANGHTWDHSANPSHTCRECGQSQYYQDTSPKMVRVVTRQRVPVAQPAARAAVYPQRPATDYVSAEPVVIWSTGPGELGTQPWTSPPITIPPGVFGQPAYSSNQNYSLGAAGGAATAGGCANGNCSSPSSSRLFPGRPRLFGGR